MCTFTLLITGPAFSPIFDRYFRSVDRGLSRSCIVLKRQKISTRFLLHMSDLTLCQITLAFVTIVTVFIMIYVTGYLLRPLRYGLYQRWITSSADSNNGNIIPCWQRTEAVAMTTTETITRKIPGDMIT